MRSDIDDTTPLSDVKAPNMFERAKEEIEALVQTIHPKKESQTHEKRDQSKEAKLKADPSNSPSASNDGKAPNFIKRAKEELEEFIHSRHHHHKETHGRSDDIDENTPIGEVKGPNVFERAKEEIDALVQAIHPKKESNHSPKASPSRHHHHKETHGRSDGIDENTPVSDIKGPNVFERAKEEIEALVQTIHPKKEPKHDSPNKEGGFRHNIEKGLEKVRSPWGHKSD
ncbi:hypothetical protein CRG98_035260 [Punica granatum]|nr:hypothetical protein CRG98_035260 [Punica granatum]